eukprot:CAMPEP_0196737778 /NCGR_PEP_ID=MMETSP1091-20130531/15402_1 /TAXON_ID=302021 /ORGANISM="Rhodomonas sp., Strain CCMP768" /LENGTH=123 /DNA_ID=CAMNT_0042081675 /DNA_START=87 /DNA_END=455 /DNA_ORIENTATION=+
MARDQHELQNARRTPCSHSAPNPPPLPAEATVPFALAPTVFASLAGCDVTCLGCGVTLGCDVIFLGCDVTFLGAFGRDNVLSRGSSPDPSNGSSSSGCWARKEAPRSRSQFAALSSLPFSQTS